MTTERHRSEGCGLLFAIQKKLAFWSSSGARSNTQLFQCRPFRRVKCAAQATWVASQVGHGRGGQRQHCFSGGRST